MARFSEKATKKVVKATKKVLQAAPELSHRRRRWPVLRGSDGGVRDISYFRQVGTSPLECWYPGGFWDGSTDFDSVGEFLDEDFIYALPFVSPRAVTLDGIRIYQQDPSNTAAAARLAIYESTSDTNLWPEALLVETDEIDLATGGTLIWKTETIDVTLEAGKLYWLACILEDDADPTKPALLATYFSFPIFGYEADGSTLQSRTGIKHAQAYGPFPDPFPAETEASISYGSVSQPQVQVRIAGVP